MGIRNATATWHRDKLYVGGCTSGNLRDDARLYIYIPTTDTWDTPIDSPVYHFSLTTYHSQLELVGGVEYVDEDTNGNITNKLWTVNEHGQCREALPPMITKRHSVCTVSYGDHLLVAGGMTLKGSTNNVEVYNGTHWSFAQPLPTSYYDLKSAILDQHWYLMRGRRTSLFSHTTEKNTVHYTSLDSLLASYQPSETSQPSFVWKSLTDAPNELSTPAAFGGRLIIIGGRRCPPTSNIHAYSFQTNSWIHVGDMPFEASDTCSIVLPTGELMVIGGFPRITATMKATIKGLWLHNCTYSTSK